VSVPKVPGCVQFAEVKRVKVIHGKFGRERAWGMAEGHTIWLDKRLRGKRRLEITLHELVHLLYPEESEENVDAAGKLLSRVLWKEGYRKVEE